MLPTLLFCVLVSGSPVNVPSAVTVPLSNAQSPSDPGTDFTFDHAVNLLSIKYNLNNVDEGGKQRGGVVAVSEHISQSDPYHYGNISIGSVEKGSPPQQIFYSLVDTGSADLVAPGKECRDCNQETLYDQSGIYQNSSITLHYGAGGDDDSGAMGKNYKDDVTILGLTASSQNVVSLTKSGLGETTSILGLGFSAIATSHQTSFFENLIAQNKVSAPEFAIFLGRPANKTESQLTLGGRIDSAYHGALTTLNVTQKGYWQIPIDGVQVENKGNTSSLGSMAKGQAIIDTGTPLIVAPIAVASKLYKSIGGAPVDASATPTIYSYRCDAPVKVSLLFAGKPFVIDPADFNAWQLNATHCQGAVMGAAVNDPKANNYVVGDSFLRNWYSIYNMGSKGVSAYVAFGAAKGNQ